MKRSLLLALLLTGCMNAAPTVPWPQPPPPAAPVEPPTQQPPPPVTGTVEAFLATVVLGAAPPAGGQDIPGGTVRWFVDGWMVSASVKDGKVTGKSVGKVETNAP